MSNIKEVAKKAGVSVATVSRIINGKNNVSEKTKKKVEDAIRELKYKPNLLARNLRTLKSRYILVLVPSLSNDFYSKVIYGVQKIAEKHKYYVMVCSTNSNVETEREYFKLLSTKLIDGIIVTAPELEKNELEKISRDYPVVQCSEYIENADVPRVSIDNYKASKDVMEYLFKENHTKIAFIGSNLPFISAIERRRAYKDLLGKKCITLKESYIVEGNYSFKSGVDNCKKIINQKDRPSAIFCCSDSLAVGAIRALSEYNLTTNDINIVGFDNTNFAKYTIPAISTVSQPQTLMGEWAINLLLDKIENIDCENRWIKLEHKLEIRETSRRI